jgi:hypothetical protein
MKICIVGNGACALKKENGNFIDSCDQVVRIKNFQTTGFEKYIGNKIDIYSSKWFGWFDRQTYEPLKFDFLDDVHTLLFMFPDECAEKIQIELSDYTLLYKQLQLYNELPYNNHDWAAHLQCLNNFNVNNKNIEYFSLQDVEDLCVHTLKISKMNYLITTKQKLRIVEPTCGIRTIYKILQMYPDSEIFLTGFDCFQTNWYWDPTHKIKHNHYYLQELMYLKQLEKTQKIIFLDNVN